MENLYLIKDLGALAGRDYRAKEIQNLQRIEQFALGLTTEFKLHQKAKTMQHFAEQIYYNGRSQAAVNKSLQSQINALVVAPRNNSANEIVQARVNVNGETFDTLKEHLDDWETKTQINKEETIRELNKTKQEILDIEYRFEPDKQEFLFVTELAPLTNAVMQSFWFDNRTGIVYMTQARNNETVQSAQSKANMAESNAKLYADDKFNKRYSVIFDGTANGVGSTLYLNESLDQFILLIFYGTFPGGDFTEFGSPFGGGKISLNPSNLPDGDGNGGGVYEFGLTKSSRTSLTISNDVYFDLGSQRGSGANANRGTINKIIGVRK